jgi:hypothetical protein
MVVSGYDDPRERGSQLLVFIVSCIVSLEDHGIRPASPANTRARENILDVPVLRAASL